MAASTQPQIHPESASLDSLMPHMPQVRAYSTSLDALAERWNLLTLLGQMSNIGMDMTETREGFQNLTKELLHHLGTENLKKTVAEMQAKAQVAVDIVIRNLFERTADIGFLATDDDFRDFISMLAVEPNPPIPDGSDADIGLEAPANPSASYEAIKTRFREYVAKYSVYDNIILLSPSGQVLAQLDEANPVSQSQDPLIREAIETSRDYVEVYRASDLDPRRERSLIYAYRITENNSPKSRVLGVLCLMFRFEDEMAGVFQHLITAEDWEVLMLLDPDGRVIASSDEHHIPVGARMQAQPEIPYCIARFSGREYLATTCATQGYQGYAGPGWFGHVMVPLTYAFEKNLEGGADQIDATILDAVMRRSNLFSEALRNIPRQADKIQKELDVTVWNGNVRIANTKSGENSFSKTLLGEISKTGARTKEVFEESIGDLNQTVVSSILADVQFRASLAIDIMDRNLYERANDCRWWALTSYFRKNLIDDHIGDDQRGALESILSYINNLYTVYTNLFLYDRLGTIVAVSNPDFRQAIGTKLGESWVLETLAIRDSQVYSVSPFARTWLYNDRHTYIYGASVTAIDNPQQIVGGIGIVFDSEPQFSAMLRDALPKSERGDILDGCFAVFAEPDRRVIASTHSQLAPGDSLELDPAFFALKPGAGVSNIVEYQGAYFVVGARASRGYREYKSPGDHYHNDVIALVFMKIGTVADNKVAPSDGRRASDRARSEQPIYPLPSGNELTTDISTFLIGGRLFGIESCDVICSINDQQVTPLVCANPGFIGVFSFGGQTVGVISIRELLGLSDHSYHSESDGILLVKVKPRAGVKEEEGILGIVIDRIMDSPEIPNRSISRYGSELAGKSVLTKAVVRPDSGNERATMLSILDVEGLEERVVRTRANGGASEVALLGRDPAH
ncbi:chemotaxis protein CheW [Thiorhodovibrio frisius]|uniref:Chemotaxis signal transduction protein n=1 Tax=Thiorhodovibrio frisius TaxID=631362 RepID=H8YZV5_9GAMM|nr:chemotaxis protein CheW [Thiorhodovibrio frisius]EIC22232.1 chemotaxis signal transduction protein [Thiorhodovibrio frisius]WPL24527.1 CheW-like domain protein [Thiorhodovibrio frisius]